jgi:hypothetical protein
MPTYTLSKRTLLDEVRRNQLRLSERIDSLILRFFLFFFSRNLPIPTPTLLRTSRMQDREITPITPIIYEYEEAETLSTFTELENPVMDSEGHIRNGNSTGINKSLYTGKPVTIIQSTELKKIQQDNRTLESKVDILSSRMETMFARMDKMEKIIEAQEKKIEEQEKKIEEQEKKIEEQEKKIEEQNRTIEAQNRTIEAQNRTIEAQNRTIAEQATIIHRQTVEIEDLKITVRNQSRQIYHLEKENERKDEIIDTMRRENRALKGMIKDLSIELHKRGGDPLEVLKKSSVSEDKELTDQIESVVSSKTVVQESKGKEREVEKPHMIEDWRNAKNSEQKTSSNKKPTIKLHPNLVSSKYNPANGFTESFSSLFVPNVLTKKKRENSLRNMAARGDAEALRAYVEKYPTIANGRGMSDSLCSLVGGFGDKTALMLAIQYRHLECAKILIEAGANVNCVDRNDFTALDYAEKNITHIDDNWDNNYKNGIFSKNHPSREWRACGNEYVDLLKEHGALKGADVIKALREDEEIRYSDTHYESENFNITLNGRANTPRKVY